MPERPNDRPSIDILDKVCEWEAIHLAAISQRYFRNDDIDRCLFYYYNRYVDRWRDIAVCVIRFIECACVYVRVRESESEKSTRSTCWGHNGTIVFRIVRRHVIEGYINAIKLKCHIKNMSLFDSFIDFISLLPSFIRDIEYFQCVHMCVSDTEYRVVSCLAYLIFGFLFSSFCLFVCLNNNNILLIYLWFDIRY